MVDKQLQILLTLKDKASKELDAFSGKISGMKPTFTKMSIVGAAAFAGISLAIKKTLDSAGELEQQTIAFETMLGSAEKAKDMLKDLSEFATKTPFEITGIRSSAKQLLAMGIEEESLLGTLKSLGDVSVGLSVPLERIALNYGQIKTQGKLTGRELRDFAVQGVPLVDELAKSLGVTKEEIADMVSAGEIGFPLVEQAFQNMTNEGGKFADLMDKQSKSMKGQISNLKDEITLMAESIGTTLIPIVKELLDWIKPVVEKLANWIKANPEMTRTIIIVSAALTGLLAVVGLLGLALPAIITGFTLLFSPITLIIVAIGVLIATGYYLIKNWDKVKIAFGMIWDTMKEIVDDSINWIGTQIQKLIDFFNDLINKIGEAIQKLKEFASKQANTVSSAWKNLGSNLKWAVGLESKQSGGMINAPLGSPVPILAHGGERIIPAGRMAGAGAGGIVVNINGGTYLSEDVALEIGNMIVDRLKLQIRV